MVFVGGLHEGLRDMISSELTRSGFPATSKTTKFPGRNFFNICNRGRAERVFSWKSPAPCATSLVMTSLFGRFVGAVSGAIQTYRKA
jgi:hypothetical protein